MALTPEQQAMEFNPELQDVSRERKLAELLTAKGFDQPQGQMISGYYIPPSLAQQLTPMANMLAGKNLSNQADTKQLEYAAALRGQNAQDIQTYAELQKTDPAKAIQFGLNSRNPTLKTLVTEDLKTQKYAEGEVGTRRNIATGEVETIGRGNSKQSEAMRNYELAKSQGYPGSFFDYETQLKKAGAPNVINQVGASLAGQTGKLFEESKATAMGGYGAIVSADKILNSTNKAITGPLANARLTGLQIADTLGITGKGEKDKIAATREVLQETGKLALSAPPKGQGQVSNYERDLYQRAASGDINFTPTELNIIAKRAKETGEYQIQQHNDLLQSGAELGPDVAKMAKLYQIRPPQTMQPVVTPKALNSQSGNVRSAADAILNRKSGEQP
jgi:hypothetical protein